MTFLSHIISLCTSPYLLLELSTTEVSLYTTSGDGLNRVNITVMCAVLGNGFRISLSLSTREMFCLWYHVFISC